MRRRRSSYRKSIIKRSEVPRGRVYTRGTRHSVRTMDVMDLLNPVRTQYRPVMTFTAGNTSPVRRTVATYVATNQRVPRKPSVCASRKARREVIFSSGRSGAGNRKPRYTEESRLKCK